jgi:acyl carrier protein
VEFVDRLPRNASGKVLKRELGGAARVTTGGSGDPGADVEAGAGGAVDGRPRTATEDAVAAVWADALGRGAVGLDEDFFQSGGHSLAAAQVAARLEDALGVSLPPTAVFEAPTVAELAAAVDRLLDGAAGGSPATP